MKRWQFINKLIKKYKYQRYLEIGHDKGLNFGRVRCRDKASVDPGFPPYDYVKPTYKMTSDQFFEQIAPGLYKWDIIFIDGLHESHQVDKDIENSLRSLTPNGSIVIHDCNPQDEIRQRVPRESRQWNGDVWKSVAKYRSQGGRCVVIDTDEGLGWIHRSLEPPEPFEVEYTYQALDKNRELYLGLR